MPFRSEAQRRFMYANHPQIAKRWEDQYGTPKNLPDHVSKRGKRRGGSPLRNAMRAASKR